MKAKIIFRFLCNALLFVYEITNVSGTTKKSSKKAKVRERIREIMEEEDVEIDENQ